MSTSHALSDDSGQQIFSEPLPLMDGGVADNQGLGSLRVALDRREKEDRPPIGLVLISDADSPSNAPLITHVRSPQAGWFSVNNAILSARVLLVVAVIAACLLGRRLTHMVVNSMQSFCVAAAPPVTICLDMCGNG